MEDNKEFAKKGNMPTMEHPPPAPVKKVETTSERLNRLYKQFGLVQEDTFKHKHFTIITRSGIDKIQAKADIDITYTLEHISNDSKVVVVKAVGTNSAGRTISTFGEASPDNTSNDYPVAMAEKRAMSRVVLKLTGFYAEGHFGEDEAEDFKRK